MNNRVNNKYEGLFLAGFREHRPPKRLRDVNRFLSSGDTFKINKLALKTHLFN